MAVKRKSKEERKEALKQQTIKEIDDLKVKRKPKEQRRRALKELTKRDAKEVIEGRLPTNEPTKSYKSGPRLSQGPLTLKPRHYPYDIRQLEIPMKVLLNDKLTKFDLVLYAFLRWFKDEPYGYYRTNETMARLLGMSPLTVQRSIRKMVGLYLIDRVECPVGNRGHGLKATDYFRKIGILQKPPEEQK